MIEEEGKDEVMLEGFMESVRALTEVDTEAFTRNDSLKSVMQEAEDDKPDNIIADNTSIKDHTDNPHSKNPVNEPEPVPEERTSYTFFKKIKGFLLNIAAKLTGKS